MCVISTYIEITFLKRTNFTNQFVTMQTMGWVFQVV